MDVYCTVIELKPNSEYRVDQWAEHIKENIQEAIDTLKDEGVTIETFFSVTLAGKGYLICYMRAKSREQANKVVKVSTAKIDEYHNQFKVDTWEQTLSAKLLFDLSRIEDEISHA